MALTIGKLLMRSRKAVLAGIGMGLAFAPQSAAAQVGCHSGGFTFAYAYCNVQACSADNQATIYVSQVLRFEPSVRIDPLKAALEVEVRKLPGGQHFYMHHSPCFPSVETAVSQGQEALRGSNRDKRIVQINVPGF